MLEILDLLRAACALGIPACIYSGVDDSRFSFGKVLAVSERFAVLYLIAPNGGFDGISVRQISDISGVDFLGPYARKYADKMRKLTDEAAYREFTREIDPEKPVEDILTAAMEEHRTVAVEINESDLWDYEGFVESVGGGRAELRCVDEFGYEKVSVSFDIDDVTLLEYRSEERRIVDRLWEKNYAETHASSNSEDRNQKSENRF